MMRIIILGLILCVTSVNLSANQPDSTHEFDPSFTHVVYFWLKHPDRDADRMTFETAVKKFMQESQYAKTRFWGVAPQATRDVVDDSFTYSLILSFESAAAQEKYQAEPAHDAFVASCKDLWEKVIVYDSIPLSTK